MYRKNNVFAARVELLQVSEAAGDFETGTPLIFNLYHCLLAITLQGWWSGGAMVLGKIPVPGRHTNLDYSMARAYCTCSRCGWSGLDFFFSRLSFLFFLPLFGRRSDID